MKTLPRWLQTAANAGSLLAVLGLLAAPTLGFVVQLVRDDLHDIWSPTTAEALVVLPALMVFFFIITASLMAMGCVVFGGLKTRASAPMLALLYLLSALPIVVPLGLAYMMAGTVGGVLMGIIGAAGYRAWSRRHTQAKA